MKRPSRSRCSSTTPSCRARLSSEKYALSLRLPAKLPQGFNNESQAHSIHLREQFFIGPNVILSGQLGHFALDPSRNLFGRWEVVGGKDILRLALPSLGLPLDFIKQLIRNRLA